MPTIPGVYVPSMYEAHYDGPHLLGVTPRYDDIPAVIDKRTVADLGQWPYPKRPLAPLTEVVHDRLSVEVFRGCTRGCRFCQAGMITRPVRERPIEQVRTMVARRPAADRVRRGRIDIAVDRRLLGHRARSIADVVDDPSLCGQTSVSLPSLRVDAFTVGIAAGVSGGRRSGLTFAPEAGSWRLRSVINKLITEDDLYGAVESAFAEGWARMKLYFLTGLPTEQDSDTMGIAELARNCVSIGRAHTNRASVTVSVGGFVPKAHTPFQWFGQNTAEELRRKIQMVRGAMQRTKSVQLKWHDPRAALAEGLTSRGDRRIGRVIERVWRMGGTFQEWGEHFDLRRWEEAMTAEGLSIDWYVFRHRQEDEVLPWDHISAGLHKDFLWSDWQAALAGSGVEDCRWTPCYDCGVCTGYGIEHVVASPVPPAGGSQGTGQDLTRGSCRYQSRCRCRCRPAPVSTVDAPAGVPA